MRIEEYHRLARSQKADFLDTPLCPLGEVYFTDLFEQISAKGTSIEGGLIVSQEGHLLAALTKAHVGWEAGRLWYDQEAEQLPFEGIVVHKNPEGTAELGYATALVSHNGNLFLARQAEEGDPKDLDFIIGRPVRVSKRRNYYNDLRKQFMALVSGKKQEVPNYREINY